MDSDFRQFLKNYGQTQEAVVMVGKQGYDDSVATHLDMALKTRELVKVKLLQHRDEKEEILHQLADKVGGEVVTCVGFQGLIYRDGEEHLMQGLYRSRRRYVKG
jgi:RNA-binding protein YhbY